MTTIRILKPGDEPALEQYLASRPDTTLFLRSNLRAVGGLGANPTLPYGGVHAAQWVGDEVTGVAGHFWNGSVLSASVYETRLHAMSGGRLLRRRSTR